MPDLGIMLVLYELILHLCVCESQLDINRVAFVSIITGIAELVFLKFSLFVCPALKSSASYCVSF